MTAQPSVINLAEQRSLRALRARFQQDGDLFSDRERAHLLFLRWLYQNGHFAEAADQP
jgi:hypothetical protein